MLCDDLLGGAIGVIQAERRVGVVDWIASNRPRVRDSLARHGVVLLRDFVATDEQTAERALIQIGDELLDDAFWSTPRKGVSGKTFTATEFAAARSIQLHSEMSYLPAWPRLIAFHALVVADEGGATTICDIDKVSRELRDILPVFHERGVIYQRTHRPGVDVPWKVAFQTEDKARVAEVAKIIDMQLNWLPNDVLQTRYKTQGAITNEAGDLLWFNQTNIFHPANLPAQAREQMLALFGEGGLPRNAFFGDGSPIPDALIHRVNATFDRHAYGVPWRPGDVLFIDNLRFAHGRTPFKGARRLHVAMANRHDHTSRTPLFG